MSETNLTHDVFHKGIGARAERYRELLQWPVVGLAVAGLCTLAWWVFLAWIIFSLWVPQFI
jgi:hypothetical protein